MGAGLLPSFAARRSPLAEGAEQLRVLDELPLRAEPSADFDARARSSLGQPLEASGIDVLQLNLGKLCNQTCRHCHVDAGPDRTEVMSHQTAALALDVLASTDIPTVDLTGGAPELCPQFEFLVRGAHELGRHIMDRCNLTILGLPRFEGLPRFLAQHRVEVVCSLPHYRAHSTDRQRGAGVFEASIAGLRRLNEVGYGRGQGLRLVLVTNPVGAFLPGGQESLTGEWKHELQRRHGVVFDDLYTITNMPISRYLEWLQQSGNLLEYVQHLVDAYNPQATQAVMCRTTLSVGWDGRLYDCDFNQMLDLGLAQPLPRHLSEFDEQLLRGRPIVTRRHCFGCTAGSGSSCGGQLADR